MEAIESVEAPDENTVVFHLSYPDGVFLAKLSHVNSAIVSPTAQQNQDLMVQPCGTGPYKFVSAVSGSNVVLTATMSTGARSSDQGCDLTPSSPRNPLPSPVWRPARLT